MPFYFLLGLYPVSYFALQVALANQVDKFKLDLRRLETETIDQIPTDFIEEAIEEFNQQSIEEEMIEENDRMDIIGQNGNEGLHYENEENTSSEQDDEKKN